MGNTQLGFQGGASRRRWAFEGQPISTKQPNIPAKLCTVSASTVSKKTRGWLRLPKAILNCLARRTLVPRRLIAGGGQKRLRRNFLVSHAFTCQHFPRPPLSPLHHYRRPSPPPHDVAPVSPLCYLSSSTVDGPESLSALSLIRVSIERH